MTNDLRVPQSLWRFQASFMPQESLKEVLSERISSSMAGAGDVLGDWGGSLPIWPVGCDQTEPKNGSIFQGVRSRRSESCVAATSCFTWRTQQ